MALCRAYSADKNWAIFLGRPPRLSKKYCNIRAALTLSLSADDSDGDFGPSPHLDVYHWRSDTKLSTWVETRWTAICASLKEDILEMFRDDRRDRVDARVRYVD
jgi:hypothetical protein